MLVLWIFLSLNNNIDIIIVSAHKWKVSEMFLLL